jgi:hypothetical protein
MPTRAGMASLNSAALRPPKEHGSMPLSFPEFSLKGSYNRGKWQGLPNIRKIRPKKSAKSSKSDWVDLVFWELHGNMPRLMEYSFPAAVRVSHADTPGNEYWISLFFWRRPTR